MTTKVRESPSVVFCLRQDWWEKRRGWGRGVGGREGCGNQRLFDTSIQRVTLCVSSPVTLCVSSPGDKKRRCMCMCVCVWVGRGGGTSALPLALRDMAGRPWKGGWYLFSAQQPVVLISALALRAQTTAALFHLVRSRYAPLLLVVGWQLARKKSANVD